MLSPVAQLLKQQTAGAHARVESALALDAADLSQCRLRAVLERFFGFWQGNERLIDEWAAGAPELATAVRWLRRRRGEVLRHDLLRMGRTVRELAELPEAPPALGFVDTADVFGWLYVSEGATLGGAVLDRGLRDRFSVRTFTPYLEGPGPMWSEYLEQLSGWVGTDDARRDRVVAAAVSTFTALEQWVAPLQQGRAA